LGLAMVKKRVRDVRNGVSRPQLGSVNRQVWDLSDRFYTAGEKQLRMTVLKAAKEMGIRWSTASVEHCMWRKYMGLVFRNFKKVTK